MFLSFLLWGIVLPRPAHGLDEIKVRHILVRTKAEAEQALDDIINAGLSRNTFIRAARKYSKDHPTKYAGGDLGWSTRGKLVKEFADVAFSLKPDEVSEPIQTQYGWHLIFVEDKRDTRDRRAQRGPQDKLVPRLPEKKGGQKATVSKAAEKKKGEVPSPASAGSAGGETQKPRQRATTPPTLEPRVTPVKRTLPQQRLRLILEIPIKHVTPRQAVEVSLLLENAGQDALRVFHPQLLPLGLSVRSDVPPESPPPSWNSISDPPSFLVDLKSRSVVGGFFYLNDYFKDLPANSRFWVSWEPDTFLQNFDKRFPRKSSAAEDFSKAREVFTLRGGKMIREFKGLPRRRFSRRYQEVPFSIFENLSSTKKYFARIDVGRESTPVWVELYADRQPQGVRGFARLAREGFYDGLRFFDIQPGNYIRGGCPRDDGTGAPEPEQTLFVSNRSNIPHEPGTLSLVTRLSRRTSSREAGSIFFISRKKHPEWDEVHAPIGKVVQGDDVLDRLEKKTFESIRLITIVPAERAPESIAGKVSPAPSPSSEARILSGTALPKVLVKTSKGEMRVELYEDDAPNTVANFIDLVGQGFYNPDAEKEKKPLEILEKYPNLFVRTGSSDNSDEGGPGYRIDSEVENNTRKHEKGTLAMCLQVRVDPSTGEAKPIPGTAGSQFFICLDEVLFWNGLYTPFGKIVSGMDVLDKLEEGDTIELVKVLEKRNHPYKPRVREN